MKIYVVQFLGQRYESVFNSIVYAGTDLELAEKIINEAVGITQSNGIPVYAYLQTWENNLKTSEKEFEI
jgi:hypothetical protein